MNESVQVAGTNTADRAAAATDVYSLAVLAGVASPAVLGHAPLLPGSLCVHLRVHLLVLPCSAQHAGRSRGSVNRNG